jgi:hypothetical protein
MTNVLCVRAVSGHFGEHFLRGGYSGIGWNEIAVDLTTADVQEVARGTAVEPGYPRVGLINGRQLVDLLVQYWAAIPGEFRQRLDLKLGLVRA